MCQVNQDGAYPAGHDAGTVSGAQSYAPMGRRHCEFCDRDYYADVNGRTCGDCDTNLCQWCAADCRHENCDTVLCPECAERYDGYCKRCAADVALKDAKFEAAYEAELAADRAEADHIDATVERIINGAKGGDQ